MAAAGAYSHQKGPTLILIGERHAGGGVHLRLHDRQEPGQPVLCDWPAADLGAPAGLFEAVAGVLAPARQYEVRDLLCKVRDELTPGVRAAAGTGTASPPIEDETGLTPKPELGAAALHGIVGDLVRLIEPATEADRVAIIAQFLAAFGNSLNRTAHFRVEADLHFGNLFVVLVGVTSKGRKGTSAGHVRRLMGQADEDWSATRQAGGLSSGEGLIWQVRDPITIKQPVKEKGRVVDYQEVVQDHGESDKRLYVMEPEFGKVLRVMKREGSTLGAIVRQAWEDGRLQGLTKNSPAKATDAHISVIGHITADELRRELDTVDASNGFMNRFLWVSVSRSKCLPDGGEVPPRALEALARRVRSALDFGRRAGEMRRDPIAATRWRAEYPALSEGKPGLLGAVTGRAEAQVVRLSLLYAVLDSSPLIRLEHLEAALALWQFCEDSARFIFGETGGDLTADRILGALRAIAPEELTRTQITKDVFNGNRSAAEITGALRKLHEAGLARFRKEKTSGRDRELWSSLSSISFFPPVLSVVDAGGERMESRDEINEERYSREIPIFGPPDEEYGESEITLEDRDELGPAAVTEDGRPDWEPPEEDG